MAARTILSAQVPERAMAVITALIRDELDVVIPGGSLDSLTLTLYDRASGSILNARNAQDVLGVNGGSVDGAGVLTMNLLELDNVLISQECDLETHVALFRWSYQTTRTGNHEVHFPVINLGQVT